MFLFLVVCLVIFVIFVLIIIRLCLVMASCICVGFLMMFMVIFGSFGSIVVMLFVFEIFFFVVVARMRLKGRLFCL